MNLIEPLLGLKCENWSLNQFFKKNLIEPLLGLKFNITFRYILIEIQLNRTTFGIEIHEPPAMEEQPEPT